MTKKEFSYETLEVGGELGTKEVIITEEILERYLKAIESNHSWYRENSPFGRPIVPTTIFFEEAIRLLDTVYARFGSIHAKQEAEFKNPAFIGEKLKVTGRVADKYIERGRPWVVWETEITGEDGREICRDRHASVVSLKT